MAEPQFANDDDLPRTLRRERDAQREAREREQRDREAQLAGPAPQSQAYPYPDYGNGGAGYAVPQALGVVNRFEVPFLHLVGFFLKAVIAAIPALILLTLLLFAGGQALKTFLPGFRHFEIVVRSPGPATDKVVEPIKVTPPAAKK